LNVNVESTSTGAVRLVVRDGGGEVATELSPAEAHRVAVRLVAAGAQGAGSGAGDDGDPAGPQLQLAEAEEAKAWTW
jgi:hypothetical protein